MAPGLPVASVAYLLACSLLGLCLMAWDKRQAVRAGRRIPERTLLLVALLGGTPGVLAGMALCRHKRRKFWFARALPVLLLLQAGWAARAFWP